MCFIYATQLNKYKLTECILWLYTQVGLKGLVMVDRFSSNIQAIISSHFTPYRLTMVILSTQKLQYKISVNQ